MFGPVASSRSCLLLVTKFLQQHKAIAMSCGAHTAPDVLSIPPAVDMV
jgi:hypothetical protein